VIDFTAIVHGAYSATPFALANFFTAAALFIVAVWEARAYGASVPARRFIFFALCLSGYYLLFGVAYCARDANAALAWLRVGYLIVPWIPAAILLLMNSFLPEQERIPFAAASLFVSAGFMLVGFFTNELLSGADPAWWGYAKRYGWIGGLFTVYFAVAAITSLRRLAAARCRVPRDSFEHRRLDLLYKSNIVLCAAGVDFLQAFGLDVYPFGYVPTLFFVGMVLLTRIRYGEYLFRSSLCADDIVATIHEALFVLDPRGGLLLANPAALQMIGALIKPPAGTNIGVLLQGELFEGDFIGQLRKGPLCEQEAVVRTPNGQTRTVSVSAQLSKDSRGDLIGVVLTVQDVSDRKRAELELLAARTDLEEKVKERTEKLLLVNRRLMDEILERQRVQLDLQRARDELERKVSMRTQELRGANERLQELDEQKSAFLSSASHELRTPLTSVLGFARLVERTFRRRFAPLAVDNPELSKQAEVVCSNLTIIAKEGERLTLLINDLLDLNKIEAGRMNWRDIVLDPRALVQDAASRCSARFLDKPKLRLSLDLPEFLPRIYADPDRILQVLANFLDNAVKFAKDGQVLLSARSPQEGWVELRVADSGPGVAQEERERIFEKFYQSVLSPDCDKAAGTGLGLAICRQIVRHYGGDILVEQSPLGGACFVARLPVLAGSSYPPTDSEPSRAEGEPEAGC
jgi:PAS domain S-box-containing protein